MRGHFRQAWQKDIHSQRGNARQQHKREDMGLCLPIKEARGIK